jgi:hypothetical protein
LASSYNSTFLSTYGGTTGAESALTNALATGKTYLDIHSSIFPGGEIRGFLFLVQTLYHLTVITNGNGTISPSDGYFADGITVILTATPNAGQAFYGWSGSITSTNNPFSVTMTNNKTITATFLFATNDAPVSIGLAAQVAWFAVTNVNYQVQAASVLATNTWFDLGGLVHGNNTTNLYYDPFGTNKSRFYRVMTRPWRRRLFPVGRVTPCAPLRRFIRTARATAGSFPTRRSATRQRIVQRRLLVIAHLNQFLSPIVLSTGYHGNHFEPSAGQFQCTASRMVM